MTLAAGDTLHAALSAVSAGESGSRAASGQGPRSRALQIAGGVAVVLGLTYLVARSGIVPQGAQAPGGGDEPRIRSIARRPLDNYSGDPDQDYFAEGMTDELTGDRARAQAELEDTKKLSLRGSVTPFDLALFAIGQGDHGRAISYLEQAYASDSQWLGWLGRDRIFDPLRPDPASPRC